MNNVITKGLNTIAYALFFQYDKCSSWGLLNICMCKKIISMTLIKTHLRLAQENVNVSPKASSLPYLVLKIFLKYMITLFFLRFVLIIFHSKYKITLSCFVWEM